MELKTHFFFAVKLPEVTKAALKIQLEKLQHIIPLRTWVHYEDLHITLAFLGYAPPAMLDLAANNAESALKGIKPFKLRIYRLGTFGKNDSPRIFFADTEESNELQLVRNQVFSVCEEAGFQLETRPFRPHITMGRKWTGEEPFQKEMLEVWNHLQPEPLEFEAAEIALYQTHLHHTPKYEAIRLYSLNKNKQ